MTDAVGRSYAELREHADALLSGAEENAVVLRLMGGLAIAEVAHDTGGVPEAARRYQDFDLVGRVRDVRAIDRLFAAQGYRPDSAFNTQFGTMRRVYHHLGGFHVDVFLERLEFCHTIELNGRLELVPRTLAPADLLLQKLQIVERNLKDHIDVWWLLLNRELRPGAGPAAAADGIELGRITALTRDDWGLHTTASDFLADSEQVVGASELSPAARIRILGQVEALRDAMAAAPKTLRWRARGRVGRRMPWYRVVEEVL